MLLSLANLANRLLVILKRMAKTPKAARAPAKPAAKAEAKAKADALMDVKYGCDFTMIMHISMATLS